MWLDSLLRSLFVTFPQYQKTTWLLIMIAITIAIRGAVVFSNLDSFSEDPDAYRVIAETISKTGVLGLPNHQADGSITGRPTAFRPPLYPFLLSWLVTSSTLNHSLVAIFHVLLGVLTVLCTVSIASRLIDGGRLGPKSLLAGLLVVVDPVLLQQSTLVMTETIATALTTITLWYWATRLTLRPSVRGALLLGILLSLAYYCRPTFLVWGALMLPGIWFGTASCYRKRTGMTIVTAAVLFFAVGLWTIRNLSAVGHPVWATSHGGYTLLLANNPSFYEYLRNGKWGDAWNAEPFLTSYSHRFEADPSTQEFWNIDWKQATPTASAKAGLSEHEDDELSYNAAKATISREPAMFLWSCFVRLGRLWSPMPHHVPGRTWTPILAVTAYYLLFYFFVFVGAVRLGRKLFTSPWWGTATLILTLSMLHAVYWSNLRMRSPAIPSLAVIAAVGIIRKSGEAES